MLDSWLEKLPTQVFRDPSAWRTLGIPSSPRLAPFAYCTRAFVHELIGADLSSDLQLIHSILQELGKSSIELALATERLSVHRGSTKAEVDESRKIHGPVALRIAELCSADSVVAIGKTEKASPNPETTRLTCGYRLAGAICSDFGLSPLRQIVSAFDHSSTQVSAFSRADAKTKLQELSHKRYHETPKYTFLQDPLPEKGRPAVAVVRVGPFEEAAEGRSKRDATIEAALRLLAKLDQGGSKRREPTVQSPKRAWHKMPVEHREKLSRLEAEIGYKFSDLSLLSIALTHSSFVHDHRDQLLVSNASLNSVGTLTLHTTYWLRLLQNLREGDLDDCDPHLGKREFGAERLVTYADRLQLSRFLCLGRTQRVAGVTDNLAAQTLRTVVAACLLDLDGDVHALLAPSITLVSDVLDAAIITAKSPGHSVTSSKHLLNDFCTSSGTGVSYETEAAADDDESPYRTTLSIWAGESCLDFVMQSAHRSKASSEEAASDFVMEILASLHLGPQAIKELLGQEQDSTTEVVRFLIERLCSYLSGSPVRAMKRLNRLGLLGIHSIQDGQKDLVDHCLRPLGDLVAEMGSEDLFESLFRTLSELPLAPSPNRDQNGLIDFLSELDTFLRSIRIGTDAAAARSSTSRRLRLIAVLLGRFRASTPKKHLVTEDIDSLRHTAERLNRRTRVLITVNSPESKCQYSAVPEIVPEFIHALIRELTEMVPPDSAIRVQIGTSSEEVHYSLISPNSSDVLNDVASDPALSMILWDGALADIRADDGALSVKLPAEGVERTDQQSRADSWAQALRRAIVSQGLTLTPVYASIGENLHDIKNLLLALDQRHAQAEREPARRFQELAEVERLIEQARQLVRSAQITLDPYKTPEMTRIDLRKTTADFIASLAARMPPSIEFETRIDSNPARIEGDQTLIDAALRNISDNAIAAMPSGGKLSLELLVDHGSGLAMIDFSDNGPGLTDEVAAHVREGTPLPRSQVRGIGLGLLSVQHIAHIHGGEFDIQSSDTGTSATLVLPISSEPEAAVPVQPPTGVVIESHR